MGDLFDGYGETARGLTEAAFDEMVGLGGATRSPYAAVASSLSQMGPEDVSAGPPGWPGPSWTRA